MVNASLKILANWPGLLRLSLKSSHFPPPKLDHTGDDPFSYQNFLIASVGGWKSAGASLVPTVGISAGTAYISSTLDGKDPTGSITGAILGSTFGYGVSTGITSQLMKKEIERKIGMSVSQNALKYMDEPIYAGSFINSDVKLSPYPGIWGGGAGTAGSEGLNQYISEKFKNDEVKHENK